MRVEFRTEESFRREYAENIARGGIFIPTRRQLDMREQVEIELVLAFSDQSVVLAGEVVHCIGPEMAETGAQPGVAIQFLQDGDDVRAKLEPFAGQQRDLDERAQGTGRRVAPRYRARVAAELEIDGAWVAGHTRNISSSGALVALPGEPPPVGSKVAIRIDHPTSSDQLEISGVVARHVDSGGTTCIGIQFRVPEASEAEVAAFVGRVQAVEHSRRLGGINGPIADLGIRSVLAMFGSCAPEGMLTLTRGGEEGYITIDQGNLRAQVGSRQGREAIDHLLSWTEGSFEFEGQADEALVNGEATALSEIVPDAPQSPGLQSEDSLAEPEAEHEPELADELDGGLEAELDDDAPGELELTDLVGSELDEEPKLAAAGDAFEIDGDSFDDFELDADEEEAADAEGEGGLEIDGDSFDGFEMDADEEESTDAEEDGGLEIDGDSFDGFEMDADEEESTDAEEEGGFEVDGVSLDDSSDDSLDDSLDEFEIDVECEVPLGEEEAQSEDSGEHSDAGYEEDDDDEEHEFVVDDEDADDSEARVASIDPAGKLTLVPDGERWELSKTEEALLDLAGAGLTVAKAIDIIPESENDIYAALENLLDEGLLTLE